MIKTLTYSILIFLHHVTMAFAWHKPGHKDGEVKPGNGNDVPEIDAGDLLLIAALFFCAWLLYSHWRRTRNRNIKE